MKKTPHDVRNTLGLMYGLIILIGGAGFIIGYAASAFGYPEMWGRYAAAATICILGSIALPVLNAQASRLRQDEQDHSEAALDPKCTPSPS